MGKPLISIVINLDTRPESSCADPKGGTVSLDFFSDGVMNKSHFFRGYDTEVILSVDAHQDMDLSILDGLYRSKEIDSFTVTRHSEWGPKWLDYAILNALIMAKGDYVAHFDQDMMAFRSDDSNIIERYFKYLDGAYDFVSYPSKWSPGPCTDDKFKYTWASTRFFICKREFLDYTEISKCLDSNEYLYGKYGDQGAKCPWLEHILGIMAGPGRVFYPTVMEDYIIFSWSRYHSGLNRELREMSYQQVRKYIGKCGGLQYPCDIRSLE